ncbi:SDR family NAD(P)-dependent oxidoreductase [Spirillospora sp. NPDC048911]|uniref:SDR family NAD(P)-dependent oxidoreductase n=1 Tax=Spirillospora sp. NPDC048911 TaxID=3364527 RepID=UPI00371A9C15
MTGNPRVPIAVVGIGAIMPDAPDAHSFWTNVRDGRYSIGDVPPERWDPELYYDPDPVAPEKTYSRIGGWVREFEWDPMGWRLPVPPAVGAQLDQGQKWSVAASRAALLDAGWPDWHVDPERAAVILGNAIGGEKHYESNLRIAFPEFARELVSAPAFAALPGDVRETVLAQAREAFLARFPEINEDTMPGELANIVAGRVANLLNLRGPNFTTDAACASGLAAMNAAVRGLQAGDFDVAVSGGVDRNMGVGAFVKFCKIGALSATGTRPFDAGADGFVMGEGCAVFVLKRLADAERDGDRIYAVLLGIAGSSDGKGKGITAPNPVGQRLAVERAWADAGLDPARATYLEAHGTSTRVGDATELAALNEVFVKAGAAPGTIALGSVKSNIGHLKAAAGAAGAFKAVMSLHDKVLAPSLHFDDPNPNVDWSSTPFRVNTELREWPQPGDGAVRTAGVSAFGFGGTNFHVVLEEYVPGRHRAEDAPRSFASADVPATVKSPPRGIAAVAAGDDAEALAGLDRLSEGVPPAPPSAELADAPVRVVLDYGDPAELMDKAAKAAKAFRADNPAMWRMLRSQGVFLGRGPAPKVAFLYPGQGSQYVDMLRELRAREPIVARTFDEADGVMTPLLGRPLSAHVFSGGVAKDELEARLLQTEITQPAVLTADIALTRLLDEYGVRPDMVMGHSLGEYAALVAAGALTFSAALEAVSARGREMADISMGDNGAMAAVFGPLDQIERIIAGIDGYVVVANINSTGQAVVGGATTAVERAIEEFGRAGLNTARIPVSHAFHTAIVAPAGEPLKAALRRLEIRPPRRPIVANVTGDFYPAGADVETILDMLGRQVASPVRFVDGLRTLYDAGARVFVEVGPKKALHGFTADVLGAHHDDVLELFTNHPKFGDAVSFNQALCGLYASGLGLRPAEPVPPAPAPVSASPERPMRPAMTSDTYDQLGRIFAGALEAGLKVYTGTAPSPAPNAVPEDEPVVVTGAALGLPGVERVFDDANLQRILDGQQFIDSIPHRYRRSMVDRRITRLVKRESGDPTFETIDNEADVIKLAGRRAPLDVVTEFGVDADRDAALDTATRLAIGAGFDALRDAGLPLVHGYKTTTLGTRLPGHWGLPEPLRDDTGVVFASAFPGYDNFAQDLERYFTDRGRREQLLALEAVRARLRDGDAATAEVDRRVRELRRRLEDEPYVFDRRFLFRCLSMGHSQFAEIIGARGPNTQVNAACASTTQALCVAGDWIRTGRCRRVIVVSADDVTSDALLPWVGAGFLASGAAATDDVVEEAATPFDRRRHGMIVGMGAAAFVVESAAAARERGVRPICEVLGAVTANSAFHGTRLDVDHIGQVMEEVIGQAEARGADRHDIAPATVFVSHETYTPARGGSAAAEINALRRVFGRDADAVVITNTKAFTGHAMGAGIEDVVAIKALETGIVPPVPNFKEPDPELGVLNLSAGGAYPVRHALRLAAGFGSQIAMSLLRWTPMPDGRHRAPDELGYAYRIDDPDAWNRWLAAMTGREGARLEVVQRRLRVVDDAQLAQAPAAPARRPALEPQPAQAPPTPVQPTPEPAPVPAAPAAPVPAQADEVTATVVGIVAEMTGYPPELLELDLDLEADLGVDTVKQAEVFAAVRQRFSIERDDKLRLRDFPTLTHVIGWIRERKAAASPQAVPETTDEPAAADTDGTPDPGAFSRRVPVPVLRPPLALCKPTGITLGKGSRIAVMPDEGGVAKALAGRLQKLGCEVVMLDPSAAGLSVDGDVHGVYWLPALDDEGPIDEMDLSAWREALRRRVKNLYGLVRPLYERSPFLVTATRLGGRHGYDEEGASAPLGGAVTGFAKAYQRERPGTLVKAVDFPPSRKTSGIADALIEETLHDPGCVEVGRSNDLRWTIGLDERPFGGAETALDANTVFLVTGAAGGIVSAITADLAKASAGTFHLLDLTPEPDPSDPDLRRYTSDPEALRADIAARLKERGERPTPVLVEKEMARYERLRAAATAIQAVRDAGGTAHYHPVDLTDADAVRRVVDDVRATSGRVDVLLHAAGIEISHTLADKPRREFDLVFDVKADGWFNLMRSAADLPIGATVAFSSVAGRFGNAGQADYSAANDLLCKLTSGLRRARPETRAIALDWTAWAGIGMASRGSIPKIMEMAGIEMLPAATAVPWIRQELVSGGRGEVLVAGELGVLGREYDPAGGLDPAAVTGTGPMIGTVESAGVHTGLVARTILDPARQPFLDDHRIDGTPVLPGVMGIEGFAELARLAAPGWHVTAVEDVAFLAPLKFYRDEPRTLTLTAVVGPDGADLVARCTLSAERALHGSDEPQRTVHFTGSVRLTEHAPDPEQEDPVQDGETVVHKEDVYDLYFHGPAFQVVFAAWRHGEGAAARMAGDLPAVTDQDEPHLTLSPRLVELCFQAAGLWEAGSHGRLALPHRVGRIRMFRIGLPGPLHARIVPRPGDPEQLGFDCVVLDAEGDVVLRVEGYRTIALPGEISAELRSRLGPVS